MSIPALDATAREAIGWMVLLQSGEASRQEQQAFDAWLRRDARHRAAWQHLAGPVADVFDPVRALNQHAPGQADAMADAMADAKTRIRGRRRLLSGALALGGISAGTVSILQRRDPLQNTFADLHTATAQRQRFALADGSSLLLNARSAADVQITPHRRQLRLRMGAMIVDAQPDRQLPFCVASTHGEVRTVNTDRRTRFLVQQREQACLVAALDQALQIFPKHGPAAQLPPGGTTLLFSHGTRHAAEKADAIAAWEHGRVTVYDRPLGEVIEAMRAYRAGFLRIASAAAALKVYGSYSLDDTDQALQSIAQTLPVSVQTHAGGWLVRIELA